MNNPTKKIDFVAFSNLRPSVSYLECKNILLSHWRELKASDEGVISLFKFGCSLSIDINGKVGEVIYFGSFPEKRIVEGLRRSMSLDDVLKIYPEIIENNSNEERWREFSQKLASGYLMKLMFNEDILAEISIKNEHAIYPKKEDFNFAKYYPDPISQEEPDFFDGNFKLSVLSALFEKGLINLGDPRELASYVLGRYIDFDTDEVYRGYESIPECLSYLLRYPLSDDLLSKIEELYFDGGLEIYPFIYYYWDGESREFDVKSLRDTQKLSNLKRVYMNSIYDFSLEEKERNKQLELKGLDII